MIFYDDVAGHLISSLGWVDGPCIWLFAIDTKRSRLVPVQSAKFVGLRRYGDVLRIVHHGGVAPLVSLRRLSSIDQEAALLELNGHPYFSGDDDLWALVDPCMLVPRSKDTVLIHLDAASKNVKRLDLGWYWDGNYDHLYQGLIDCLTLPDRQHVVVAVQRSSRLVVMDILKNRKVCEIELAERGGNPHLVLQGTDSLLAIDYDTICRVDLEKMETTHAVRLQEDATSWVGDFTVQSRGIIVARPFYGDALLVDDGDFSIRARAITGAQPLQAVLVSDSHVLGRDWKTGHVVEGELIESSPATG